MQVEPRAVCALTWLVARIGCIVFLSVYARAQGQSPDPPSLESDQATVGEAPSGLAVAAALERATIRAIETAAPSIVAIARVRTETDRSGESFPRGSMADVSPTDADFIPSEYGAGIVVGASGEILTNYHLLGDPQASKYFVWHDREPYAASVVAADPWFDLAVLKIDARGLVPIKLNSSLTPRRGQFVIALGNPQAIARDGSPSASWGIIANVLRRAPRVPQRSNDTLGRETIHHYGTLLQTDVRIANGLSGAALVDLRGRLVGVLTSLTAGVGFDVAAGLAVPVDSQFERVVNALRAGRVPEFGFLGVAPEPLAIALRRQGLRGARIAEVFTGTPADSAGLRPGDLIVRIDGQPVVDDVDLFRIIGSTAPGSKVVLGLVRQTSLAGNLLANRNRIVEVEVELSKKRVDTARRAVGEESSHRWRGASIEYVTAAPDFKTLADRIDSKGCVFVEHVAEDSAAWRSGLRTGDLISHVDEVPISTPIEFVAAVQGLTGDVQLRVIPPRGDAEPRIVSP